MKSLPIDLSIFRFTVVNEPEAVTDFTTKAQKSDRNGQPLFAVDVLASRDGYKSEVITVKIPGKPSVSESQKVKITGLEALPWEANGRSGVSFSAVSIEPLNGSSSKAA